MRTTFAILFLFPLIGCQNPSKAPGPIGIGKGNPSGQHGSGTGIARANLKADAISEPNQSNGNYKVDVDWFDVPVPYLTLKKVKKAPLPQPAPEAPLAQIRSTGFELSSGPPPEGSGFALEYRGVAPSTEKPRARSLLHRKESGQTRSLLSGQTAPKRTRSLLHGRTEQVKAIQPPLVPAKRQKSIIPPVIDASSRKRSILHRADTDKSAPSRPEAIAPPPSPSRPITPERKKAPSIIPAVPENKTPQPHYKPVDVSELKRRLQKVQEVLDGNP